MKLDRQEVFERVIQAYQRYYNIEREDVTSPFSAEASFHSNEEQYFLIRGATLSTTENHEYVFFSQQAELDLPALQHLDRLAWETGISRTTPNANHRSTDVALVVVADVISPDAMAWVKKAKHSKSYRWNLYGFSNYRLVAIETSTGKFAYNRLGESLKKLVCNIVKES